MIIHVKGSETKYYVDFEENHITSERLDYWIGDKRNSIILKVRELNDNTQGKSNFIIKCYKKNETDDNGLTERERKVTDEIRGAFQNSNSEMALQCIIPVQCQYDISAVDYNQNEIEYKSILEGLGVYSGSRIVVTEYQNNGLFLSEYDKNISLLEKTAIVVKLIETVKSLHSVSNYLHLDLHPGNVFLEGFGSKSGKYQIKLIDFGNSKKIGENGTLMFTRGFSSSPVSDVWNSWELQPEDDLYSIGAIFHWMVFGSSFECYIGRDSFGGSSNMLKASDFDEIFIKKCKGMNNDAKIVQRELRELFSYILVGEYTKTIIQNITHRSVRIKKQVENDVILDTKLYPHGFNTDDIYDRFFFLLSRVYYKLYALGRCDFSQFFERSFDSFLSYTTTDEKMMDSVYAYYCAESKEWPTGVINGIEYSCDTVYDRLRSNNIRREFSQYFFDCIYRLFEIIADSQKCVALDDIKLIEYKILLIGADCYRDNPSDRVRIIESKLEAIQKDFNSVGIIIDALYYVRTRIRTSNQLVNIKKYKDAVETLEEIRSKVDIAHSLAEKIKLKEYGRYYSQLACCKTYLFLSDDKSDCTSENIKNLFGKAIEIFSKIRDEGNLRITATHVMQAAIDFNDRDLYKFYKSKYFDEESKTSMENLYQLYITKNAETRYYILVLLKAIYSGIDEVDEEILKDVVGLYKKMTDSERCSHPDQLINKYIGLVLLKNNVNKDIAEICLLRCVNQCKFLIKSDSSKESDSLPYVVKRMYYQNALLYYNVADNNNAKLQLIKDFKDELGMDMEDDEIARLCVYEDA